MKPAYTLQRDAVLLAAGAIIGGVGLGLLLSKQLSRPLEALTAHVARVGEGDFDSRLDLSQAAELRRLSHEVNAMASGLKERMMLEQSISVATQVQQSLLPSELPTLPGLEIAACSKYCESMGGDYYDFIHVRSFESHQTLIAVGDVTGHGIGAAMLMSTARGAVRVACESAPSLGHILARANDALAGSVHQGMFMTLSLLFVNPQTGFAHWSSAGHDPVIVYHPGTGEFDELRSGDVPLGIEPDIAYREFSRHCAQPGTVFVIGTDGIWEARNPEGEMFGKDRLRDLIRGHHHSAQSLSIAIKAAMQGWIGDFPLRDDVTFVLLRVAEGRASP
jgi:sigma-B regulation protein RsbU (phosphoserine phosphatase)